MIYVSAEADARTFTDPDFNPGDAEDDVMKQYWPGIASAVLFLIIPAVMRHTRFKGYITAYMYIMLALEVLLLVAVLIVRRNRWKAQQTMP